MGFLRKLFCKRKAEYQPQPKYIRLMPTLKPKKFKPKVKGEEEPKVRFSGDYPADIER